jgi:putative addiction module component (TIGR02574 family)
MDQLKTQVAALSAEERADLTHFLLESLEPDEDLEVEAAWERELNRRVEEIKSGTVRGIPADQAFDLLGD